MKEAEMKLEGSPKQKAWAEDILKAASLTAVQLDNLLRQDGPAAYAAGVLRASTVINHRFELARYADALGSFYKMTAAEKHAVAEEACQALRGR